MYVKICQSATGLALGAKDLGQPDFGGLIMALFVLRISGCGKGECPWRPSRDVIPQFRNLQPWMSFFHPVLFKSFQPRPSRGATRFSREKHTQFSRCWGRSKPHSAARMVMRRPSESLGSAPSTCSLNLGRFVRHFSAVRIAVGGGLEGLHQKAAEDRNQRYRPSSAVPLHPSKTWS